MFPSISIELTSSDRPIRLQLFSTGKGKDKTRFRNSRISIGGQLTRLLTLLDAIFDPKFTDYLPIWVLVIQHPEGTFLIDTGATPQLSQKEYFRPCGWVVEKYISTQFHFEVSPTETIAHQLKTLHINSIILTHLHFDHIDGLKYLPGIPTYIARQEVEHPFGNLPKLYPKDFQPNLLNLNEQAGFFKKAKSLTKAQDIILVHTPGHTYGHCSVLIKTDTCHLLFAGDVCYSQEELIANDFSANLASRNQAQQTYNSIKQYAMQHPLIFLPSHDPDSANRLQQLEPLLTPVR